MVNLRKIVYLTSTVLNFLTELFFFSDLQWRMVTFLEKYALGHTQFLFYFIFLERMGKKIFLGTPLVTVVAIVLSQST
jgi:uncharacterized membrane protein